MPDSSYSSAGPNITVKALLKRPALIARAVKDASQLRFIGEALFDSNYNADGGSVSYSKVTSNFMDDDVGVVAEGAEYPVAGMQDEVALESTLKYGLKTPITQEAVERNQLGVMTRAIRRLRNQMVRALDNSALQLLLNAPEIPVLAAGAVWDKSSTTIFDDIYQAVEMVNSPKVGGESYVANTLVVAESVYTQLLTNGDIRDAFDSLPANERPIVSGHLNNLGNLAVISTPYMPDDTKAFVLARKDVGGIADERPLEVRVLGLDEDTDRYWIKCRRLTAMFITDPGACVRITGVK